MDMMIDLETLGTSSNAVVTQLGWALFDPKGNEGVYESGGVHLEVQQQIDHGLSIDWDTIKWWMRQTSDAREVLVSSVRSSVTTELVALSDKYIRRECSGVWSHGSNFDITIMENLYRRCGMKAPWGFRSIRDTRTLFSIAGDSLVWPKNRGKHIAEFDAIAQAIAVQRAFKIIERK